MERKSRHSFILLHAVRRLVLMTHNSDLHVLHFSLRLMPRKLCGIGRQGPEGASGPKPLHSNLSCSTGEYSEDSIDIIAVQIIILCTRTPNVLSLTLVNWFYSYVMSLPVMGILPWIVATAPTGNLLDSIHTSYICIKSAQYKASQWFAGDYLVHVDTARINAPIP